MGGTTPGTAGNDTITTGGGDDSILAYGGNDTITAGAGNDTVYGGDGNDVAYGGNGADSLWGGNGDDREEGGAGADHLYGDGGNDTLAGGAGADTLDGGSGMDYADYSASAAAVSVNLQTGLASGGDATGDVLSGVDGLIGSAYGDVLTGADGQSTLAADAYTSVIFGGGGNDTISAGSGNDTIYGGAGDDSIGGWTVNDAGDDTVYGDAGNDRIIAGAGNDIVYGGTGDDWLCGQTGNDTLYGDAGNDTFAITDDHEGDTLHGGENAGDFDLVQFGNYLTTQGVSVTFTGSESGSYTFLGSSGSGTFSEIEGIAATSYDDSLNASAATTAEVIYAGAGNDTVTGGTGADWIASDAGNDLVHGGDGADTLDGGAGDDALTGGAGADLMMGGAGQDTLLAGAGDTVDGGEGQDLLDLRAYGFSQTQVHLDPTHAGAGTVDFLNAAGAVTGTMQFTGIETIIICFTPGTTITTLSGEVAVEDLVPGDMVLTRDNGYRPLRWVGRRDLTAMDLSADLRLAPVRIARGALGAEVPQRDMLVSPQHRLLLVDHRADLLFATHEVLVPAVHLVGLPGIARVVPDGVSYLHLLFDDHEIIRSDGAWSESFQPASRSLGALASPQREEVLRLFPELRTGAPYPAARMTLKAHETRLLVQAWS